MTKKCTNVKIKSPQIKDFFKNTFLSKCKILVLVKPNCTEKLTIAKLIKMEIKKIKLYN